MPDNRQNKYNKYAIYVESPEISYKVQEELFKVGYRWDPYYRGTPSPRNIDMNFLYIYVVEREIRYGSTTERYIENINEGKAYPLSIKDILQGTIPV